MADPVEALREGLRRYRRLALDHPRTYEVMFFCSIPGFEPSDESHVVAASSFEVLVQAIDRGMQAGAFTAADPVSVAQQMWSACHGAVALEIADICMVDDMETVYEELLDHARARHQRACGSVGITSTRRTPGSCSVT